MKILSIQLENFLCFSGSNNKIEFADGLNLILGANGYGKTKLYDAFNWVFFDKITNQKGTKISTSVVGSKLISRKATESVENGVITCKVSVEVQTSYREDFRIERIYSVNKIEGRISDNRDSNVEVDVKTTSEYRPYNWKRKYDSFSEFISEKIIPTDVLGHIWFQGERGISKAIDTSNASTVRDVINRISYIDLWQRYEDIAKDAYKRVKKRYDDEVKKSNKNKGDIARLQEKQNSNEKKIKSLTHELDAKKADLEQVSKRIDEIIIDEEAYKSIESLKTEQSNIENQLRMIKSKLSSMINRANRNLFEAFWVVSGTEKKATKFEKLLRDYTFSKQNAIRALEKNVPIMPRGVPGKHILEEMLNQERCFICNTKAIKGSENYKHIESLLPKNYPQPNLDKNDYQHERIFNDLSRSYYVTTDDSKNFYKKFKKHRSDYYNAEQERLDLQKEFKENEKKISLILLDYGIDSLDRGIDTGKRLRNLNSSSSELNVYIGRLKSKLDLALEDKEKIQSDLDKLVGDDIDKKLKKQYKLLKSLVIATEDAKKSQFNKLIKLLENQANKHYENINKETGAFFGKIKFHKTSSDGYTAKIHDSNNDDVTDNMNTSQILSMQISILLAILSTNKNKILNKKYPLIADAPNSAFDIKKRESLLREIGRTFDQSIIMMFEYLVGDLERKDRYKVDMESIKKIKNKLPEDTCLNVIHLDIPEGVNPKILEELEINIIQY